MEKEKKLRGSAALKVTAFLLAWVFAACFCAGAVGCFYLYERHEYYQSDNWKQNLEENYRAMAQELFFLDTHRSALTKAGMARFEELNQALGQGTTNFRYRVVSQRENRLMLSNTQEEFAFLGENLLDPYTLGCSTMLAYYLDMDKVQDWELRVGTSGEWAKTGKASRYYYDPETYTQILEESNLSVPSMDVNEYGYSGIQEETPLDLEEEQYEEYSAYLRDMIEGGHGGETIPIEEYFSSSSNAGATDAEDLEGKYYYFVYTGDSPQYYMETGLDQALPVEDEFAANVKESKTNESYMEAHLPVVVKITGSGLLCFLLLLTYLTAAAGWNRAGELALRGANRMPVEMASVIFFLLFSAGVSLLNELDFGTYRVPILTEIMMISGASGAIAALGALILWLVSAAQIKTKTLLERSLTVRVCKWLYKWFTVGRHAMGRAVVNLPLYWKTLAFCGIYWFVYQIYMLFFGKDLFDDFGGAGVLVFGTLPLIPLAVLACKWSMDWAKLRQGVKEMVSGHLDCQVNTSRMLPDLKAHGDDLSSLSTGLSRAVDERLKSERFKTELITNVSHDLKTPLTSIINYVDLLKKTDIQDETAREYIEVLDRKSQRLKTLTEDLVEASKAASGTISVQLDQLDVNQLVDQAVAEYDERLSNAALTPVVSLPAQPCLIMADGRHLWRILDNLLGNCTKYAMPGTRVYLDVVKQEHNCVIAVKNISADPLNVPAEELMKRFVRGDSARSTEGSGLGLSIARNLTSAQGGAFDLTVDGDLFKATVAFPLIGEKTE